MDWRVRRIVDNVWGPTGTILIHVVVIFVLLHFTSFKQRAPDSEFETMIVDTVPPEELDEIEEKLDELEDIPTPVDVVAPPEVSLDQEPPQMTSFANVGAAGPDVTALADLDIAPATSPIVFKNIFASRSAAGRSEALGKYAEGKGGRTEYAVLKALKWLKNHQYPDGSWGPRYRSGMTGLALLTFLAHGETTSSKEYGNSVKMGLQFLLRQQRDGVFTGGGPIWHGGMAYQQIKCYEHAIATYAISEAYALTQIPFLRYSMEDAIQVIIDGQHAAGSWDYDYRLDPEANVDTSLSGWHIQALKAALAAGASNRGLKTALESAMRGLKSVADGKETGMFRYGSRMRTPESDISMTGVAVLCMQLGGHALDAEARAGIQVLKDVNFRWTKSDLPGGMDERRCGEWPLYAWYYITQARFHQGGGTWVTWNRQWATPLCDAQNDDGSWCPPPGSQEALYGPVYCTTLSALMLQVYYRLLPTYKEIEVKAGPSEEEKPEEEIVIKFG